jgi:hypothetical protein
MYYYKHKSKNKTAMAEKTIRALQERTCPSCREQLTISESGVDRDTFVCEKCKSISTFTKLPDIIKKEKVTELGMLKIREQPKKEKPKEGADNKPTATDEIIVGIRECLSTNNLASFYYTATDGTTKLRNAEPYKLMKDKNGEIIMYAYDLDGEGIRVFKLRAMTRFAKQDFTYKPRWEIEDKLEETKDAAS